MKGTFVHSIKRELIPKITETLRLPRLQNEILVLKDTHVRNTTKDINITLSFQITGPAIAGHPWCSEISGAIKEWWSEKMESSDHWVKYFDSNSETRLYAVDKSVARSECLTPSKTIQKIAIKFTVRPLGDVTHHLIDKLFPDDYSQEQLEGDLLDDIEEKLRIAHRKHRDVENEIDACRKHFGTIDDKLKDFKDAMQDIVNLLRSKRKK